MNTQSINKIIERETGLRKSERTKDYVRDSDNGNIAYRLRAVDRWRNGDFHIQKYYQDSYDLYFDNVDSARKADEVIKALEDAGCVNIIPHVESKWIRFDMPSGDNVMNGYERNVDSINTVFESWFVGEPENLRENKDYRFLNPEDFDGYEYVQAGNDFYKGLLMSADWELVKVNADGYNTFVCVDTDKKLVRNPTEREYFLLKAEPITEDVYQQLKQDYEKERRSFLGVVPPAVIKDYLKGYKPVKSNTVIKTDNESCERNEQNLNKVFNQRIIKSERTFDDVELQILFDNIVGGQDEMFLDWYTEKYGDIPWNNLKSIPKERIAEYVNENPDVLEDMEYEIRLSYEDYTTGNTQEKRVNEFLNSSAYDNIEISFRRNFPYDQTGYVFDPNIIDEDSKTITFESDSNVPGIKERINRFRKDVEKDGYKLSVKSGLYIPDEKSTIPTGEDLEKSFSDHLDEYVSSDSFVDTLDYNYNTYIMDKLSELGFSSEEIEFEWDSPKIKKIRDKIDNEMWETDKGRKDYLNWCASYIKSDKYRLERYQQWLRANGYPSIYDVPFAQRHSFDHTHNTYPGPQF